MSYTTTDNVSSKAIEGRLANRPFVALLLALGLAFPFACNADDADDLYRAKEGDSCRDCRSCEQTSLCVCNTCSYYATDEAGSAFLQCCGQKWVAIQHCPGGVSVSCPNRGGYLIKCFDAEGREIPGDDFGTCSAPK
ncbi:MAG: hypothetical protein ABW133_15855 [Polyangiaceae bacterium]